jgi:RNA polymerase sigma-70 factor (ECF subfamily)
MSLLDSNAACGALPGTAPPQGTPAPSVGQARAESMSRPADAGAGAGQLPLGWFRQHFTTLWRLGLRLGVPEHSVEDVVQETFIVASRRRADIVDGQERRFLIATLVRMCANYRRRANVRRELALAELLEQRASGTPDAEQLLIEKRARQELELALAALSDAHRSVFVLYELEGFSVREIAEVLALPGGTVASRLGRARAQFSRHVQRLQRAHGALPEVP